MAEDAAAAGEGGRKLVRGYIDGCFDIMHSGHFNAIRQAKSICDVLVVGVHSDKEIEENKSVPVMRQAERYGLLEHIKWIGQILHDVPYSPQMATLERAQADFCIHGDDMPVNAQGVGAYDGMRDAGKLRIIKRTEGVSTTDLIGRLLTLSRHQHTADAVPAEHPRGVRVSSDQVIQHCSGVPDGPGGDQEAPTGAGPVAGLLAEVDAVAAKYSMSPADVARLKDSIGGIQNVMDSRAPATADGFERQESSTVRTAAPVQLLASTRRITEFASGRQPGPDDKVVYVCGSFDMFHVGHAQFLKDARALGTFLFVGIHSDSQVSQAKGSSFPVMTLNERVLNVCACKWVDEVIIGSPKEVTEDLIKTWNIHVVVRGTGHMRNEGRGKSGGEAYAVPQRMGIYQEVPSLWPELCHETVVQRIIRDREIYLQRNRDRARREDAYYATKSQTNSPLEA